MSAADVLIGWLKGPCLFFSLCLCLLGLARLAFAHCSLIITAVYNSRKTGLSYGRIIRDFTGRLIKTAKASLSFPAPILKWFLAVGVFVLSPILILDHIIILNRILGTNLPALSRDFGHLTSILAMVYVAFLFSRTGLTFWNRTGKADGLLFWALISVVFGSGIAAVSIQHFHLLKILQIVHFASGNLLLIMLPFTTAGAYLVFPIIAITSRFGTWFFPAAKTRDETGDYFNRLRNKS
ncbi:hypothetical protein ACFL5V_07575 [Fibrobacterota bacterium]